MTVLCECMYVSTHVCVTKRAIPRCAPAPPPTLHSFRHVLVLFSCFTFLFLSFSLLPFAHCIGANAFRGCSSLVSVAFPDGLQTIGDSAYQGCSSLTSVAFPDTLQTIGKQAPNHENTAERTTGRGKPKPP